MKKLTKPQRVHYWVVQALEEVELARSHMQRQYAGPEHEALRWAQQFLENALAGKAVSNE